MKLKTMNNYFSGKKFLFALLFVIPLMFAACKKSDSSQSTPVAGLMAFNLIPSNASIGIDLSGSLLSNSPLLYTNYTGTYLNVYPGQRSVTTFNAATNASLAATSFNFEPNKYYSVFALGKDSNYTNLVVNDELDTLTSASGQAYIRYVNAIPDSSTSTVTVSSNNEPVITNSSKYASISEFKGVTPGDFSVSISNGSSINASRTVTLEKNKVYTVLLVGIPGETDTTRSVQIKYIANGTLTP